MKPLLRRVRGLALALLLMASVAAVVTTPASPAQAAGYPTVSWPSSWQNPTQSGSTFVINTYWGALSLGCKNANRTNGATYYLDSGSTAHTGVDMARGDGQVVVAIADGTVVANGQWGAAANHNAVVIEHTSITGEKFLAVYGHLYPDVVALGPISAGARVGRVETAGTGAHLHFGVKPGAWTGAMPSGASASTVDANGNCSFNPLGTVDPLSYLSASNPGGAGSTQQDQDGDGVPDAQDECPLVAGLRTTSGCPPLLVARQKGSNALIGKVGLNEPWTALGTFDGKITVSGSRLAVRTAAGELWAKDGLGGTWLDEASSVTAFGASPGLLVARQKGSNALIGKVGLNEPWTALGTFDGKITVSGSRLAVLTAAGELWAKDGLGGTWLDEASSVTAFGASPGLLVARQKGSNALIGKVGLNEPWTALGTFDGKITVSGSRLAVRTAAGELWAKDGLGGTWLDEASSVTAFGASPGLLVARQKGSNALIGKVGLNEPWTALGTFDGKITVSGSRLAVLTAAGELWAKDGLGGTWLDEASSVTAFGVSG